MKKAIILVLALVFMASTMPAFAGEGKGKYKKKKIVFPEESSPHAVVGVMFDAPRLIGLKIIHPSLFLGVEGGKNIMEDPFRSSTRRYVEDDKGYFGYAKVTYYGCWFFCPGEK